MRNPEFEHHRQQLLMDDSLAILSPPHDVGVYRTIAATVPKEVIRKALSEIRHDEASDIGDPVAYSLREMAQPAAQGTTMKKQGGED